MKKILAGRQGIISALLIRNFLEMYTNTRILVTQNPEKVKGIPVIRYGNSGGYFEKDTSFNHPNFIKICSNKYEFSSIMKENEIYSPIYTRNIGDISFPLIIRNGLSLSKGKGIHVCKNMAELGKVATQQSWMTKYIYTDFELRVHVLGGKISRVFKKHLNETEKEFPIRNNDSCHFGIRDIEKYPKLDELVNKLSEIFGKNNFYAMDIGWDSNIKKYFIFELNSAPGLNEATAQEYARFLSCRI